MPQVTWKGEDATPDLEETTRFGILFKKGEAVEVEDEMRARKLKSNPNFEVEGLDDVGPPPDWAGTPGGPGNPVNPPVNADGSGTLVHTPPSQQSAQYPVAKGGEPINPEEEPPPLETKPAPEAATEEPNEGDRKPSAPKRPLRRI